MADSRGVTRRWIVAVLLTVTEAVSVFVPIAGAQAVSASAGLVMAWGSSYEGRIRPPLSLVGVAQMAADGAHSLAVKTDGTVVAWGDNSEGQSTVPAGLTGVVEVAAGRYHSLALKSDGTVVAWGSDGAGQTDVPPGLTGVVQVAGGDEFSLAVKSDGTVVAWGDNSDGQTTVPAGLTGVIQVAAGADHSLAVKSDGTVVAWGSDSVGQTNVAPGLTGVVQVAGGADFSLALKSDGTVVAWGGNFDGQTTVPAGLTGVIQVAAGWRHSLALKSNGTVVAWGNDHWGQTTVPAGLTGVSQVTAGDLYSLALVVHRAVIGFSKAKTNVAENAGVVNLPVRGTNAAATDATVSYSATGGTARAGVDFTLKPATLKFLHGQTDTRLIPLKIINDRRHEPAETIVITLRSHSRTAIVRPPAAITVIIAVSDQRPDMLTSTAARHGFIGKNIFNTTGAGQTVTLSVARSATKTCYAMLYNAGDKAPFVLQSDAAGALTIRYYWHTPYYHEGSIFWYWANVTREITSPDGRKVLLGAPAGRRLRIRITPAHAAKIGTKYPISIAATFSGDVTRTDLVKARVRVVR